MSLLSSLLFWSVGIHDFGSGRLHAVLDLVHNIKYISSCLSLILELNYLSVEFSLSLSIYIYIYIYSFLGSYYRYCASHSLPVYQEAMSISTEHCMIF